MTRFNITEFDTLGAIAGSEFVYVAKASGSIKNYKLTLSALGSWIGGGGGSVAWGGITGTLSNQTDLQAALNAKLTGTYPGGTTTFLRADGAFAAPAGGVTSVGLTMPGIFSVSGSPVTGSGTLAVTATDPGADRIAFWDDSAGNMAWLTPGTNLAITGTTLDASGGGGVAWGAITGTLSAQTDLQAALDAKVTGPASATSGRIAVYNGTTGELLQDGTKLEADVVTGPASATTARVATFNGTTGKIIQDGGVLLADLVVGPASVTTGRVASYNGTTGKLIADGGILVADVVTGPASATSARVATFNGTSGKIIQDGGTLLSALATLASPTFTGTPAAPTAAVDTNTTQLATTAFVVAQAASATPAALGTAAVGTSLRYARGDHVHSSVVTTTGDILYSSSGVTLARLAIGTTRQALKVVSGLPVWANDPQAIVIACSDETTALTTGVAKATFRMPFAFTLTAVRASVTTAPTGGTLLTVDINESGTTIISTKITIDASEKTSTTAATPPVISDSTLADDAEITIDIDAVGSTIAGAGLKVYLIGYPT